MKYTLTPNTISEITSKIYSLDLQKGYSIEIKAPSRSSAQNRALHLYFTIISRELQNLGITFTYSGLKNANYELPYTPELVKEFIWKPIQIALFDIKTTTRINSKQINDIIDVLTKFFAERGIKISFPSFESLMFKNIKE